MCRCSDGVEGRKILEEFHAVLCVLPQSRVGKGGTGFISMASAALPFPLGWNKATVNDSLSTTFVTLLFARLWKCTHIIVKVFSKLSYLSLNTYHAFLLDFLVIVIWLSYQRLQRKTTNLVLLQKHPWWASCTSIDLHQRASVSKLYVYCEWGCNNLPLSVNVQCSKWMWMWSRKEGVCVCVCSLKSRTLHL